MDAQKKRNVTHICSLEYSSSHIKGQVELILVTFYLAQYIQCTIILTYSQYGN